MTDGVSVLEWYGGGVCGLVFLGVVVWFAWKVRRYL